MRNSGEEEKAGGTDAGKMFVQVCLPSTPPLLCVPRPLLLAVLAKPSRRRQEGERGEAEKGKILLADKRPPQKKARRRRPFSSLAAHDIWAFVGKGEGKTRGLLAAAGVGEEASVVSSLESCAAGVHVCVCVPSVVGIDYEKKGGVARKAGREGMGGGGGLCFRLWRMKLSQDWRGNKKNPLFEAGHSDSTFF